MLRDYNIRYIIYIAFNHLSC